MLLLSRCAIGGPACFRFDSRQRSVIFTHDVEVDHELPVDLFRPRLRVAPITAALAVDLLGRDWRHVSCGASAKFSPFGIAKFAVNVSSPDTNKNANRLDGCVEYSRVFSMGLRKYPENWKFSDPRKLLIILGFYAWCPWPAVAYSHNHLNLWSFYPSIAPDTSRNTSKMTRGIGTQK